VCRHLALNEMFSIPVILTSIIPLAGALYLYIRHNDKKIMRLPDDVAAISAKELTPEVIHATAQKLVRNPITVTNVLPPKTGRRYMVVGGVCAFTIASDVVDAHSIH
jgi:hypothetical protein